MTYKIQIDNEVRDATDEETAQLDKLADNETAPTAS